MDKELTSAASQVFNLIRMNCMGLICFDELGALAKSTHTIPVESPLVGAFDKARKMGLISDSTGQNDKGNKDLTILFYYLDEISSEKHFHDFHMKTEQIQSLAESMREVESMLSTLPEWNATKQSYIKLTTALEEMIARKEEIRFKANDKIENAIRELSSNNDPGQKIPIMQLGKSAVNLSIPERPKFSDN